MVLPFLGLFIMLLAALAYYRKRNDRHQQEVMDAFWAQEQAANLTRRKDISGLSYISIPFDHFSIGVFTDTKLTETEQRLKNFQDKKILNLTGQTNTDLKLQYGPANLPFLMECDQNFTDMLHTLTEYSNRLIELEHLEAAIPVLEFCVSAGSDVSSHYITLANYYKAGNQTAKLAALREHASALNSLMKSSILQKIDDITSE